MRTYKAAVRLELKPGTPVTSVGGKVHTNFGLETPFSFRVMNPDHGTDRQRDEHDKYCVLPERPNRNN